MEHFNDIHITPFVGNDPDTDILLFFTDNHNEPRRLNVRRCIEGDEAFTGNALGYEGEDLKDFITACPKVSLRPITFEFTTEYAAGSPIESNFKGIDGMVFSYQNVYKDGFVSALATYSKVAYPPSMATLGQRDISEIILENLCTLTIPSQTKEISHIRILFKIGDYGTWKIIDEVSTKVDQENEDFELITSYGEGFNWVGRYSFRNERIYAILPIDEATKNYDNLPPKAEGQTIVANRLMYGNYVEGFDNVQAKANSFVTFKERPKDLSSFVLAVNPLFIENEDIEGYENNEGASAGFEIDGSGIPGTLESGDYEIQINFKPRRNIHVYDTKGYGYRGSTNISTAAGLDFSAQLPQINLTGQGGLIGSEEDNVEGVTSKLYLYGALDTDSIADASGVADAAWMTNNGGSTLVKIGSTPAAPLILDVDSILATLNFTLQAGNTITNTQLVSIVYEVLTASSGDPSTLLDVLGVTMNSISGEENPNITYGTIIQKNIDVGLTSGTKFNQSTSFAELICTVPNTETNKPRGFFILNKATAKFGFEAFSEYTSSVTDGTKKGIRLKVINVESEEILTCFPKPAIGLGTIPRYTSNNYDGAGTGDFWNGAAQPWGIDWADPTNIKMGWPRIHTELLGGYGFVSETSTPTTLGLAPYRIGEWLALDAAAVGDVEWQDFYSVTLNGIEGTQLANALGDINADEITVSASSTAEILGNEFITPYDGNGSEEEFIGQNLDDSPSKDWEGVLHSFSFGDNELDPESDTFSPTAKSRFSVVDGDVGPGGRRDANNPFSTGTTHPTNGPGQSSNANPALTNPKYNRWGSVWSTSLDGFVENLPFLNAGKIYTVISVNQNLNGNFIEKGAFFSSPLDNIIVISNLSGLGGTQSSFKTRATHDFGIVYYDERGRASAVNKLTSVYVPGYSDTERPGLTGKGAVSIRIQLLSSPPVEATDWRIFYSNRNNAKRFIQYSAADAFSKKGTSITKSKIYVSLAHLQGHDISYSEAYGARTHDTDEPTLYRYSSGDKLRVISYYTDETTRVWADDDVVFDVLGVEDLSDLIDDHPLHTQAETDLEKIMQRNGSFVVLKNNDEATGFTTSDIDGGTDLWKDRVVFEIISPEKETVDSAQPYFETKYGGKCLNGGHHYNWQPGIYDFPHVRIEEGDVFFRGVPMNVQDYNTTDGVFENRIDADLEGNDISQPRLERYHLETEAATDLYRSAAKGYGKPNFINPFAKKQRQQASIIFSQKTTPSNFKLKYLSFPPLDANSFHLPEKYGAINYLIGKDEQVTSLQQNKVSVIPLERSITSTAQGKKTLNLTDQVLNLGSFYSEDYGPSNNPESVLVVDGMIYFVDKSNQVVVSITAQGAMSLISSSGMEEYFKRQIKDLLDSSSLPDNKDVRIVSGFNPNENEYIVSFLKPETINSTSLEGLAVAPTVLQNPGPIAEFDSNIEPFVNTIAFDHIGGLGKKLWKTRYSFNATNYARVNNKFISFKPTSDGSFVWLHGAHDSRNNFHGIPYYSMLKTVSNSKLPSTNKEFRAISFEGNSKWPSIIKTSQEKTKVVSFNRYEGLEASDIKGSFNESVSTANVLGIGVVESFEVLDIGVVESVGRLAVTFKSPVNRYPLNLGEQVQVYFLSESGGTDSVLIPMTPVSILGTHTIRYSLSDPIDFDALLNGTIIHKSSSAIFGDTLRDKFATITSYNDSDEPVELYAINVEATPSKLDASS